MPAFLWIYFNRRNPEDTRTTEVSYLVEYDSTTPFWRGPWEDLDYDDFEKIDEKVHAVAYKMSSVYHKVEIEFLFLHELPPDSKWMKGRSHRYYMKTCPNGAPYPMDIPTILKWDGWL